MRFSIGISWVCTAILSAGLIGIGTMGCGGSHDPTEELAEMTLELSPGEVTRPASGTLAERSFEIEATINSTYTIPDDEYVVEFSADPTNIISDAWVSSESTTGATFDYPNVSEDMESPGERKFKVTYQCMAEGETTLTGKLRTEDEGTGALGDEDTAYVNIKCEAGEECGENHPVYGAAVSLALLLQFQLSDYCSFLNPLTIATILHSSQSVGQKDVAHDHTTFVAIWAASRLYTLALLQQLFLNSDFDCGQGENGYTICPTNEDTMEEGDFIVLSGVMEQDIPLDDPDNIYQYGFVVDADGNTDNNYEPNPSYPNDFFTGTDRWYTADYTPTGGWTMGSMDATDSSITSVPTAARIIIRDNAIFLVVPAGEFSVTNPGFRVTAFRHTGDYGMNPPNNWDGSIWPAVADGLEDFPTTGE